MLGHICLESCQKWQVPSWHVNSQHEPVCVEISLLSNVCSGKAPGQCEGCGSSTRWQHNVDFQGRRYPASMHHYMLCITHGLGVA